MKAAIHVMDLKERAYRHCQLVQALEPFGQMLFHIHSIMPHPGYIVDISMSSFEPLPPLPEWQKRIDRVIKMRQEYIKDNFPEFYEE